MLQNLGPNLGRRFYNFVPNWVQIVHFPVRDFLAKLTVTIVYLIYSFMLQHFKKILKEQIMGQKTVQFWPKLGLSYFPKRLFFEKVDH